MTADLAQELINFREDQKNREVLANSDWYRKVGGFPATIDLAVIVCRYNQPVFRHGSRPDCTNTVVSVSLIWNAPHRAERAVVENRVVAPRFHLEAMKLMAS
jgi:hypothetical protein